MAASGSLLDALLAGPLALYPALAALLLAAVGLASGLLRGDVLALARPVPVAWVLLSVPASWAVQRFGEVPALSGWDVATLAFAPLALIALAYGPTPALVALALTAAWVGLPASPEALHGAYGWLLGLELVVLGWLAIAPSPRSWRFIAGPYLLLAHTLTIATAGLASVVLTSGPPTLASFAAQHARPTWELLALAAALALLPPAAWRSAFPHASLGGPSAPVAVPRSPADARHAPVGVPQSPTDARYHRVGAAGEPRLEWQGELLRLGELQPWARPRPARSDPGFTPIEAPRRYGRRRREAR